MRGFFKVNVLALFLNMVRVQALTQLVGAPPLSLKLWAALRIVVLYPMFLYANFSGYIDIVDCVSAPDAFAASRKLRSPLLNVIVHRFLESLAHDALQLAENRTSTIRSS